MNINRLLLLLLLSISIFILSCNREKIYNGELGFQVVGIGDIREYKDENGVAVIERFDTLSNFEFLNEDELKFKKYYEFLKKNEILDYEPILLVSEEKINRMFLPENEFQKISQYKRASLLIAKRKVLISILGTRIDSSNIKGLEILSIEEVAGSTFYKK